MSQWGLQIPIFYVLHSVRRGSLESKGQHFRFKGGLDSDFEAFELKHALLHETICTDLNLYRELLTFWASGSKFANLPRLTIP